MHHCKSSLAAEEAADLFLKIGQYEAGQARYDVAVNWLERGREFLRGHRPRDMRCGADDLHIIISQNLVRALMHLPGEDAKSKALQLSEDLCMISNDKSASLVVRLDLLKDDPSLMSEDYTNVLLQFVRTIPLNDSFLKTFLQYFHNLRSWNAILAHAILEVILQELSKSTTKATPAVVDKVLITMIWSVATSADLTNSVQLLERTLTMVNDLLCHPIATNGSDAAQVVRVNATPAFQACALKAYIALLETCRVELQAGKIC